MQHQRTASRGSESGAELRADEIWADRFWAKVDHSGACWEWQASKGANGYGQFKIGPRPYPAHRVAYALAYGVLPAGLCVCHRCDNRQCVRPDHLFLGTQGDNIDDALAKGRIGRLTPDAIDRMCADRREMGLSLRALGAKYGVSSTTVHRVLARRSRA